MGPRPSVREWGSTVALEEALVLAGDVVVSVAWAGSQTAPVTTAAKATEPEMAATRRARIGCRLMRSTPC